ncbi:MAG: hypothetical protein IKO07_03420 [Clostridia bacterium]|nr:hypothetical protein [Clostridia bacterium]
MNKTRIIRASVTVLTLALAVALIASALALYLGGSARREAANTHAAPPFTREDAAQALRRLAPLGLAWLATLLAAALTGILTPARGNAPGGKRVRMRGQEETKKRAALRAGLYGLAALLVALGVLNGGLNDVLVKAINICTECIGLG